MFLGNPKDILPKRPYSLQYNSTLWANQEGPGLPLFRELAKTLPKNPSLHQPVQTPEITTLQFHLVL